VQAGLDVGDGCEEGASGSRLDETTSQENERKLYVLRRVISELTCSVRLLWRLSRRGRQPRDKGSRRLCKGKRTYQLSRRFCESS